MKNKTTITEYDMLPDYSSAFFADGGGIHIDPSKKGTFKAQATRMEMSVQEAASTILNAPEGKYSPEMRKKANFAKNFAKQQGGEQQDQVMQLIQMYAQLAKIDPNELVKKLQSLQPQEQQAAIQEMSQTVEQAMSQQQESQMQYGGGIMGIGTDTPYVINAYKNALGNAPIFDPINALVGYAGLADAFIGSAKGYGQLFNFLGNPIDKVKSTDISTKQDNINKNRAEQFRVDNAIKNSPSYDDINFKPYSFGDTAYARFGGSYLPFAQTGKFIKPDVYDDPSNIDFNIPLAKPELYDDPSNIDLSMFETKLKSQDLYNDSNAMKIIGDSGIEPTSNLKQSTINNSKATSSKNRFDANTALQGLASFNNYLNAKESRRQIREYNEMLKRLGNTDSRNVTNPVNPFGNYTLNVGPGQNFQLNRGVPSQDLGAYAKYGGTSNRTFKEGGEYQVSQEELIQLMKDGAEIEFI